MDIHALAVLAAPELWDCLPVKLIQSAGQGGKLQGLTAKLLSGFIEESHMYPDSQLVNQFWFNVEKGHPGLRTNIERLRTLAGTVSREATVKVLFEGIDPKEVDFSSVLAFAAELFTHFAMAFQNLAGPKSGGETPHSVTEFISKDIDELLREAEEEEFGSCRQEIMTVLEFKRDGVHCLLTAVPFVPIYPDGVVPILSHVISNSIHKKPDTLKFIAMFAGTKVRDLVVEQLNGIGNIMNLECNTSQAYDDLKWAIQAKEADDGKVSYIFRKFVNDKNSPGPGFIKLRDGDEIPFGKGEGRDLEGFPGGPLPALCNLQYAVARVLRMSGAADLIAQLKEDADDSDLSNDVTTTDFVNILTAKLLLNSGRFAPFTGDNG